MRELRERAEPILKLLCLVLAAVVLYELVGAIVRLNPFHGVTIPDLPALGSATNTPPVAANAGHPAPFSQGTNTVSSAKPASLPLVLATTNAGANMTAATNSAVNANLAAHAESAPPRPGAVATVVTLVTNAAASAAAQPIATNTMAAGTILSATGAIAASMAANGGTNLLPAAGAADTNSAAKPNKKNAHGGMPPGMAGMGFSPGQMGGHPVELPPAVQARIGKIVDSEILGPVMHPLPMGLLGIAGEVAFLRSDSGQTGLEKEGDTLDDIKLLKIGVNRVLIEQNGQKKELLIFSGYGGESLLSKDTTNENKHP